MRSGGREVRLLRDAGRVGDEDAGGDPENLLIRGEAVDALLTTSDGVRASDLLDRSWTITPRRGSERSGAAESKAVVWRQTRQFSMRSSITGPSEFSTSAAAKVGCVVRSNVTVWNVSV